MSFGILYVATGDKCVREACVSASSVRQHMPDIPATLYTDIISSSLASFFDNIVPLENPQHSSFDKIAPLIQSPYEKTLFLDSDTLAIEAVYELADLMDRFDLAYCHAPVRKFGSELPDVPDAFPEANTGVLVYRKSTSLLKLFHSWAEIYKQCLALETPPIRDQPAFRQALYHSDIRATVLPSEYNLRTHFPFYAHGKVKILHGRGPSLEKALRLINNNLLPRMGYLATSLPKVKYLVEDSGGQSNQD